MKWRDADIDPFHVCGNAAKLEYRTIRLFYRSANFLCFVLQFGCIPTDVKGVYYAMDKMRNRGKPYHRHSISSFTKAVSH